MDIKLYELSIKADKYVMCFTPDMNKITRQDGNIETITKYLWRQRNR